MDLIQLKMPPERAKLLANVVDTYIEERPNYPETGELREISVWLRYRISRWNKRHPDAPAA